MARKSSDNLRRVIGSVNSSTPSYNPSNVYRRGKNQNSRKAPKRINYDVTLYDFPGNYILFNDGEIAEKSLKVIGRGSIVIVEDYNAQQIYAEIAELAERFFKPKSDLSELSNSISFFKRIGRKRVFIRHQHSSTFRYDASGIKDLCGKDCKALYVILKNKFPNQQSSTAAPINLTLMEQTGSPQANNDAFDEYDFNDDSNDFDDLPPYISASSAKSHEPVVSKDVSIESYLKCKDLLNKQVYEDSKRSKGLMTAMVLLAHSIDFSKALEIILRDSKASASDIEHVVGQVFILFNNDDYVLWNFALEDLIGELKVKPSDDVVEIYGTPYLP